MHRYLIDKHKTDDSNPERPTNEDFEILQERLLLQPRKGSLQNNYYSVAYWSTLSTESRSSPAISEGYRPQHKRFEFNCIYKVSSI